MAALERRAGPAAPDPALVEEAELALERFRAVRAERFGVSADQRTADDLRAHVVAVHDATAPE